MALIAFVKLSFAQACDNSFEEEHQNYEQLIVIDEIQKLPALLDEVRRLIFKKNFRFLLTGSSSRKIKRGSANLLAGRAWQAELFPLTSQEINDFNLEQICAATSPALAVSQDGIEIYPWQKFLADLWSDRLIQI